TYTPSGKEPHKWDLEYLPETGGLNPNKPPFSGCCILSDLNNWGDSLGADDLVGFDMREFHPTKIFWEARVFFGQEKADGPTSEMSSFPVDFFIGADNRAWVLNDDGKSAR